MDLGADSDGVHGCYSMSCCLLMLFDFAISSDAIVVVAAAATKATATAVIEGPP